MRRSFVSVIAFIAATYGRRLLVRKSNARCPRRRAPPGRGGGARRAGRRRHRSSARRCRSTCGSSARSSRPRPLPSAAQITGQLTSVGFKEGDDVKQGEVLFTLDRRPLEAALKQAEANLQRDIAQAANADVQAQRLVDLAQRGIATREQVDTSKANAAALDGDDRRRSRRRRQRADSAAVRDDRGADHRPHRRADGARRQPGARQRHDAARRHQPALADQRHLRRFPKRSWRR